jgi:quercetin dioxygenase-like cupin family protein
MKVINIKDIEVIEMKEHPLFTGGKVYSQPLIDGKTAKNINVGMVKCDPGGHNVFHIHSNEQVIFVTEGRGIVATEDKEVIVTPGMIIYIPPGEKHWHGATKDSSFEQLSIVVKPEEMKIVDK